VDLTQLNTTYENCEDQKEGYHLRIFFEYGDETSFQNPKNKLLLTYNEPVAYREGFGGFKPPQKTEILGKLSRIPSSVENTSITT
jgi:hypothetical protein